MVRITLLSAPNCDLCEHAKEVLSRIRGDHPVVVEAFSIETEPGRKLMIEHRMAFPPGVFIDGQPFSYGLLSERKLRRELARRNDSRTTP